MAVTVEVDVVVHTGTYPVSILESLVELWFGLLESQELMEEHCLNLDLGDIFLIPGLAVLGCREGVIESVGTGLYLFSSSDIWCLIKFSIYEFNSVSCVKSAGNGEICEQGGEIWETVNESETADCIVFHPY